MAQVKPMGLIESMSGKVCEHSDMYFFRKNGKVFSGKICNPSTKEPSENQLAAQAKFKTARTNAKAAAEKELKIWDIVHTRNTGVNDTPLEYAIKNMSACAFDS